MTNNNLIASLLRDDKSKMAALIACGASAVALIYYNREVRNQIANIFMVRFLLLLFVVAVVFRWSSFIIIIIIISLMMMMMMVMTMPLLACERETTRLIFRECWYCARWTTRVVARERGRWRVDKPEKRDWIFGSKFSLAAVIISSSSSSSERLLFSGFDVTLSRLFLQNARRRACSVHNACVCVLIYWPTVFLSFYEWKT